jgi:biotin transport system permease protein
MSQSALVGLYQPGRSVLHRLPVGVKLIALAVTSVSIVVVRGPGTSVAFLGAAFVVVAMARLQLRPLARASRSVVLIATIVALFQWWLSGRDRAIESFLDLVSLSLFALTISATTQVNAMLDAFVGAIGPLHHVGVDPERIALTIALAIGALPGTITLAQETRDAARARGLGRHPRAFVTPFVIRVVARAYETGDALAARGIGDS